MTSVATYADNIVLRGRSAVAEVGYGKGHIVLIGFRAQFRAQPYGTYKFLFNSIYRSVLEE